MAVSFKTAARLLRGDGTTTTPDIERTAQFLAANARVLDRRRYERLFAGGGAQPVRDAVAAYRNPDGGFGHALEPDVRTPVSQTAAVKIALRILHETDVWEGDRAPDRDRALAIFDHVAPLITGSGIVTLDPDAPGEVHSPLDFAPRPDSLARALFDEAIIKAQLDQLAHAQLDDGGWTFNWLAWSPAAERDWRGYLTVDALSHLRANGCL